MKINFGQKEDAFIIDTNVKKLNKEELELNKEPEEEIISSLSSKYKNEILVLKKYIQKMNLQIRNHLNMEILPSIEEGFGLFSEKTKPEDKNLEKLGDKINEWLNKILNIEYIDPLITLYEKYISNLEDELKNAKKNNKNYENLISKLVNENNDLRNQIEICQDEMKTLLEIRNESDNGESMIIMDRDYIMKIEERNQLLSKENEILVVNYNKLQNEMIKFKNDNFLNINEQKDKKYSELNQKYLHLFNEYNLLKGQFDINNKKVMEISDNNNNLEIDNQKLKEIVEKLEYELNTYKESNQRYENLLNKN